ncbi:MAG: hypothetical protein LBV19_06465 [Streptococcaceae bacterium]|jgi:hypothetical protein|nr:hypothetical protein [Streptococcaceae bacterium]
MTLDVDKRNMTIMNVKFDNFEDFDAVLYAVSSNMIEGWEPKEAFIEKMKVHLAELRKGAAALV